MPKQTRIIEIWPDGEQVQLSDDDTEEPLYGDVYLPRKFKVAIVPEGDIYDEDFRDTPRAVNLYEELKLGM